RALMTNPRPATHDLMKTLIQTLDAQLTRVLIHALDEASSTYFARLVLMRDSAAQELEVDARPSDSIALALRLNAPIFVAEDVLARSAVEDKARINKEMDEFRKFLADVKPGDFARYDQRHAQGPDRADPDKS
ncbi:MAG: bifunctional nuclease family protein, partial [bacterium]